MRIQLVSDLHLERYPDFTPSAAPDVDVLVLAGDIGSYQPGSLLKDDDFGLGRFSPRRPDAPWPRVLYIPGNHEFDSLEFEPTCARLKATCERLGIEWLDREVITIGQVRFVGTTLWSDFEAFAKAERTETKRLQALEKAYRAANFYLRKNTTLRGGIPMLAEDMRTLSQDCQTWLSEALSRPFDGTTIAVTHFAPTLRSGDPRYGATPGTAGFCNSLDHLLPQAQVWMHGHLHCAKDYVVSGTAEGRPYACRVMANPRGYFSKGEQQAYQAHFVIDLP
ncbi:MAG: metallophosphoesterase [Aquabacterium sp.]|uniref:metallophosphoesterase n=1 Tax=Aquabacterium sp. TaxID=1872578 RepID=UPI0025C58D11|nr:metallophosphoesterase [Aquabacterium sp.]MBI5926113.1 metallophosphoesterase [Aquabacterium sp.]